MEKLIFTLVDSGKLVPFLYLVYLFLYTCSDSVASDETVD